MSEREPVTDAIRRIAGPDQTIVRYRLAGSVSAEQYAEWQRLRNAHYFLVRNRGRHGERFRCGRCSTSHVEQGIEVIDPVYHEFFTYACVDRPWRGLDGALWGYATMTQDDDMQTRLEAWGQGLGDAHPMTYGRIAVPERSVDIVAIALAIADDLEDITKDKADALVERINARLPAGQRFRYEV